MKHNVLPVFLILIFVLAAGCRPEGENLAAFIHSEKETRYEGTLEYMHTLHMVKEEKEGTTRKVFFRGEIEDLSGGENPDQDWFLFTEVFTVKPDRLIHTVEGKMAVNHSIIPDKIILKTPLKEGNRWTQNFTYQGKKYQAQTEIIKIEGEQGKREIRTETRVEGLKAFPGGVYKEISVYKENEGLVYYERTLEKELGFNFQMWKAGTDISGYIQLESSSSGQ
ncbi:hypothetical protein SAMN02745221_01644 [Thermosyntropha lipolytica DSM 11003]|uniref:Lipoprotein n=1 Tax=Thermosyntropha lipolytica DSM 11003 TaxID=1123382 RepID=A0A1M5Q3P4_9FIRM|nr:hypothetical protein [Thermosyntropha lipolytica]SHH08359.1 hypothetical protein SAMN02745221_01644 [Thermosyntropha lipolytica DSM 11003]